ncbi:3-oxoadipate enol-lactonase [Neopusillimonas maritima]|mgnify:CR=1 FL=1|uniref:3-oxoadipate enol-lactonase n=1 Tax=Neopusillimonas maritima TaxID=2026239 RepID=A0ABX9MW01_9BURK|nr:3-oxoadipate enol-lactonase [Neopusillimonas maritima]MBF22983.1 3-oxoadipate enol-lactonase [Pusillimonas sp.]RII83140.1 3-oxoadipate enol-lactonase [Neopusillimonas maritima]|tara:strand:- start:148380 stop:149159 length:780 start_codon:yes stop_codon:yes gene_type:complete
MPYVKSNGVRLAYDISGPEGAPFLILSNSIATTKAMWNPQLDALSKEFRVVRYDTRGHGKSDVPFGPYSIDDLGQDVLGLLDKLKIDSAHFCGLSLGGMTGMWLASKYSERVNKLVLCHCVSHIGNAEMWNKRIAHIRENGMSDIAFGQVERWFRKGYDCSHPDIYRMFQKGVCDTPVEGYVGCCAVLRDADLSSLLSTITSPTLVVGGREDIATPPEKTRVVAQKIKNAEYMELEGGHLSNWDSETDFTNVLNDFLRC